MNEYETIKALFGDVKDLFKSDAQIIEIAGEKWGMTCDTFSLEEDLFTPDDPYRLGHNLVCATLSDLTASGCTPAFFMQSMILPKDADQTWIKELTRGIKETLNKAKCTLIGGDMGQSDKFSYTGIALGKQTLPVSRIFPNKFQFLYVTGKMGEANKAILTGAPTPEFKLHELPKTALACIDTSGGFMDALWQLHTLNPDFQMNVRDVPVDDIKLLFGGAGEYELLFSSKEAENAILIGSAEPGKKGVFLNGKEIKNAPPDPRSFKNISDYIGKVTEVVHELFG